MHGFPAPPVPTRSADAVENNQSRMAVPGLSVAELRAKAEQVHALGNSVGTLETILRVFKQQQLISEHDLHESLRRVLAGVRAGEKFDAGLADAFLDLIQYFDNASPAPKAAEPATGT